MEALVNRDPAAVHYRKVLGSSLTRLGVAVRATGQPNEAAAALRRAIKTHEGLPARAPDDEYDIAGGHAQLSAPAGDTAAGKVESDLAWASLRRAITAGYDNVALLRDDSDLGPIRARPEFRLMLMDLEFPPDPFAR